MFIGFSDCAPAVAAKKIPPMMASKKNFGIIQLLGFLIMISLQKKNCRSVNLGAFNLLLHRLKSPKNRRKQ